MFRTKSLILAALTAAAVALPTFAGTPAIAAGTRTSTVSVDSFFDINVAAPAGGRDQKAGSASLALGEVAISTSNGSRSQQSVCLPLEKPLVKARPANTMRSFNQIVANGAQDDWLKELKRSVAGTGIPANVYVKDTYDCDDFAGDLEIALTALGYNATFTVYWCKEKDGTYTAHALTDVHWDDDTVVWIEPQTGEVADLDFDGDGSVEVSTTHGNFRKATDGNCRIEFYDSRAAAETAGVVMD